MVRIYQSKLYHQPAYLDLLINIANSVIGDNEILYVALKGTFKEFLFCTDKNVYIVKQGYMTGHTFGNGIFSMPHKNITNAEVNYGFLGNGYFEISAGGMQNTRKSYWSNDPDKSAAKQPNSISIASKVVSDSFNYAKNFILEKVNETHMPVNTVSTISPADEILKYKKLLDEGIITDEEFILKKKELLRL